MVTANVRLKTLGGCPRIENLLRKSWIWPDFPIIFVKYSKYSPQIMKKSDSNQLSLATAPILGQPTRRLSENRSLLRKSGFWSIFPIKCVKYSKYSPYLIEKMASKPLSLATTPILGQPPSSEINWD